MVLGSASVRFVFEQSLTFNPFSIKQRPFCGTTRVGFDFSTLDTLQVKCLRDVLFEEQVFHNKKVCLRLNSVCLHILYFDCIEAHQLRENGRPVGGSVHISEV